MYKIQKSLQKLRLLKSTGQLRELSILVQKLKNEGYPKSILKEFVSMNASYRKPHPYIYPWHEKIRNLGILEGQPLVSIIIVSYNSGADLTKLLPTLSSQSYTNWELILIENGKENTYNLTQSIIEDVQYHQLDNPGFAEANNFALDKASGELILLLNPDTKLEEETLKQLVHGLSIDNTAAAVCPKIYFWAPFNKITFSSKPKEQFNIDIGPFLENTNYRKVFVREGIASSESIITSNEKGLIILDLAFQAEASVFEFLLWSSMDHQDEVDVKLDFNGSGEGLKQLKAKPAHDLKKLDLSKRIHSASRYLINNFGSNIRHGSKQVYDVGFGEEDYGQYGTRIYREAFCGCCVLLRRDLFINRKIFISQFFAYFEDSELSLWIRSNKMNILCIPSSIIYHKHAESTAEGSNTWKLLVERSSSIYQEITKQIECPTEIGMNKILMPEHENTDKFLISKLQTYNKSLEGSLPSELIAIKTKYIVGIYNSYWNSLGGGEKHALDIACLAKKLGHEVYLICEKNFSIDKLSNYYELNLDGMKKIIASSVSESLTQRFDIFVNSTYHSSIISRAKKSYYVVSFPHQDVSKDFLSSYIFLHNSEYTKRWAQKFWGDHLMVVLNPVLGFKLKTIVTHNTRLNLNNNSKEKLLFTVGRFDYDGHCKNQHIIARAFNELSSNQQISSSWKLIIAGSVDELKQSSTMHFNDVEEILAGCNAIVIPNMERKDLMDFYRKSLIYIHAAGMQADPEKNPERFEHFGISVFESLMNNCVPIVHENGGPSSQVRSIAGALQFTTYESLKEAIVEATRNANLVSKGDVHSTDDSFTIATNDMIQRATKEAVNLLSAITL